MRYEPKEIDNVEEQVRDYMDRALQYRIHIHDATHLRKARKFSHVFVKYAFFKAGTTQTERHAIQERRCDVEYERRYTVDVNDEFVKYVASSNLTLEV